MIKKHNAKTFTVHAPAKINTGLRVLSKRKDGFHNIETIFYPVKLYDKVTVNISIKESSPGKGSAKCNLIAVKTNIKSNIEDKKNICYRAAELFLRNFKIEGFYNIKIRIKKRIPIGAGLGGGSSDAAYVLKILAGYFGKSLTGDEKLLKKTALELGSDVPFFLDSIPSYGTGRGGKLKHLKDFKIRQKILLVNPGIHVATSAAYKELRISNTRQKKMNKIAVFDAGDTRLMINDFEKPVFRKYPVIEVIKYDMFRLGAVFSLMSGSGSTVFGLFGADKIKGAYKFFKNKGYSVFYG